jgi:hypothetical protein
MIKKNRDIILINPEAIRFSCILYEIIAVKMLNCKLLNFQNRKKGLLRNFNTTYQLHPLLTFFLLFK